MRHAVARRRCAIRARPRRAAGPDARDRGGRGDPRIAPIEDLTHDWARSLSARADRV